MIRHDVNDVNNVNDDNDDNDVNDDDDVNGDDADDVKDDDDDVSEAAYDAIGINDDADDRCYGDLTPEETDSFDRKRRRKTERRFGDESGAVDPELRPDLYFRPIQSPRREEEEEEEEDLVRKPKSGSLLNIATRKILSRSSSYYE